MSHIEFIPDPTPWLVWSIVIPLAAAPAAFLLGRRVARFLTLFAAAGLVVAGVGLTWQLSISGTQRYAIGGWGAPLGIDLYADGLSVLMVLMSIVVGTGTSVYALGYFSHTAQGDGEHTSQQSLFWPLWLFLWAALHALFLSADVFNLYVTLELLGLAAVALVNLAGGRVALLAGMRYLLTSLLGSLAYLLGVTLLYGGYGTLDLQDLGGRATPNVLTWTAGTLITAGLVLKTALFPLHFWLPPAHASAPAPVSALLSALVVKASFYIFVRLWVEVFPAGFATAAPHLLGALGGAAIIWGSVLALRQSRLKLLIAYSTVAQIGYLFLVFPLLTTTDGSLAWSGGIYHALSHACAKAAMFMTAGCVMHALGHDRIDGLGGISQQLPVSIAAFALASLTIMGLPPSGGFIAKWLLLSAALEGQQWGWVIIMIGGGLLAAGYVFVVLKQAFVSLPEGKFQSAPRSMEIVPLLLALISLALGLTASYPLELLQTGAPFVSKVPGEG